MKKTAATFACVALTLVLAVISARAWDVVPPGCMPAITVSIEVVPRVGMNRVDLTGGDLGECIKKMLIKDCQFCSELSLYEYNAGEGQYNIYVGADRQTYTATCDNHVFFSKHTFQVATKASVKYRAYHKVWKTSCLNAGLEPDGSASEVFEGL